jgi:hypothetical protein
MGGKHFEPKFPYEITPCHRQKDATSEFLSTDPAWCVVLQRVAAAKRFSLHRTPGSCGRQKDAPHKSHSTGPLNQDENLYILRSAAAGGVFGAVTNGNA